MGLRFVKIALYTKNQWQLYNWEQRLLHPPRLYNRPTVFSHYTLAVIFIFIFHLLFFFKSKFVDFDSEYFEFDYGKHQSALGRCEVTICEEIPRLGVSGAITINFWYNIFIEWFFVMIQIQFCFAKNIFFQVFVGRKANQNDENTRSEFQCGFISRIYGLQSSLIAFAWFTSLFLFFLIFLKLNYFLFSWHYCISVQKQIG